MISVKKITKILLLSLVTVLPLWSGATLAADKPLPAATEQIATVNINTASASELSQGLTGVGMKRAESIVTYRDANGAFTDLEQLLAVKGIGEKILEKNRDRITLE